MKKLLLRGENISITIKDNYISTISVCITTSRHLYVEKDQITLMIGILELLD